MAKSKNNVLSNKLDQAAKSRKNWYGKVVESMKDEMIQAMNETNIPLIILNESDQAPKTRAAGYAKRLEEMKWDIEEAMDRYFLDWSEVLANYINEHQDELPIQAILDLKPGEMLSVEVKREDYKPRWWDRAVGHAAFLGDFDNFLKNVYCKTNEWPLKEGQRSLIIVVKKDKKDPKMLRVHAEQLEIPWPWAMVMEDMFFHNPNVDDKRFKEIMGD